ncbi:hypothetical protein BDQ17DRAFT_1427906 [Cyathus striatus]|nr:hypothetical protein BDQ17DRAFT_1427906 [Cyathus striatus]
MSRDPSSSYSTSIERNGLFYRAHNFEINNSLVMDITVDSSGEQLSELYKLCSRAAIFDLDERGPRLKCLKGTARSSLDQIHVWSNNFDGAPVLWLSGPLGTGKTSIAQTMAEKWAAQKRIIATFFFSPQVDSYYAHSRRKSWIRGIFNFIGNEYRSPDQKEKRIPIMLTLVYQLVRSVPDIERHVLLTIRRDPSILDAVMSKQFRELILLPLQDLQNREAPVILLIDALDECRNAQSKADFLALVTSAELYTNHGIKFLISSRPERLISEFMHKISIAHHLHHVSLERTWETDADIALYLTEEFKNIHKNIPTFQHDDDTISELVDRSSGQFIFASTIVNYIGEDSQARNPTQQLEDIMKVTPAHSHSRPFQNLDALYFTILVNSRAKSDTLIRLLGYILATGGLLSLSQLDIICSLKEGDSIVTLRPLLSLLQMPDIAMIRNDPSVIQKIHVQILHASFGEFLADRIRSQQYHVDVPKVYSEMLSVMCTKESIRLYQLATVEAYDSRDNTLDDDKISNILEQFSEEVLLESMSPIFFVVDIIRQIKSLAFLAALLRFWPAIIMLHIHLRRFRPLMFSRYFLVAMCMVWPLSMWSLISIRYHFDIFSWVLIFLFPGVKSMPLIVLGPFIITGTSIFLSAMFPSSEGLRLLANISVKTVFGIFLTPIPILCLHMILELPFSLEIFRIWVSSFALILWARPQMESHVLSLIEEWRNMLQASDDDSQTASNLSCASTPKLPSGEAQLWEDFSDNSD